jgi:hypothetical protein
MQLLQHLRYLTEYFPFIVRLKARCINDEVFFAVNICIENLTVIGRF